MTIEDGNKVKKLLKDLNSKKCLVGLDENEKMIYICSYNDKQKEELEEMIKIDISMGKIKIGYICEATMTGFTPLFSIRRGCSNEHNEQRES